jgi:hypothetical protein
MHGTFSGIVPGVADPHNAMSQPHGRGCGRSHLMHITARKHNSVTLVCHSRLKAVESQRR